MTHDPLRPENRTLAEALNMSFDVMSPAERKVARALIAEYPVAGLEPVAKLAERANVSAPTVLRMLARVGIQSYPHMQELLREEISERTTSPIDQYESHAGARGSADHHLITTANEVFVRGLNSSSASVPASEFDHIIELLADPKRRIWAVGGRYSGLLAEYLTLHLRLLRPDVRFVGRAESDKSLALLDMGGRDVLIAFDYRRYQDTTVEFVERAKQQRVTTVLLTDPWLSPAAKHADYLISSAVEAPSPFDSLVPSLALVETLIAGVVARLGAEPVGRIQAFDAWE
ncbi:DNA-binding MurR/RpiR family transcriptional regulator [Leucobacter exalbidus]|uniref:DNA-binding MurR/RpiR family transcriptional regulator n=1 Tax=Leucobacter exalbidus TaxID=662960 RepID=A0A940T5H7_9MICO|nr:MurR/RpiR family transcriptional regulator [Leucobacter exalbidus]MBP1326011.1 DNA-binding MurR/RpiR family transcriptional regulator [Leucobacter exalbidus]